MGTGDVRNPTGSPGPAGCGRAERPQKYSSVRREGSGTCTVVRGKGEGWGGEERDRHHEKFDEGPRVSTKAVGLKDRGQEPRD